MKRRDVRCWHQADIAAYRSNVANGVKADIIGSLWYFRF